MIDETECTLWRLEAMTALKRSTSLISCIALAACASSPDKTKVGGENPSSDAKREQTPPPIVPEGEYQAAALKDILSEVEKSAPGLVDPTGKTSDRAPGLVVGVVTEEGTRVLGFGATRINSGRSPDGETYFGIGSVTKVFTGLVLADAVHKGVVGLDDSANKYLPVDLKLPADTVTLRHLVTHTSGLPNFPANLSDYRDNDADGIADSNKYSPGRNYSRQNLGDWLKTKPALNFRPGQNVLYSNLGSGVLSIAMQTKLNYASFDALNNAEIAQQLGMARTLANTPEMKSENLDNKAQGYFLEGSQLLPVPFADMGVLDGAGELVSTGNDMVKFIAGLAGISETSLAPAFKEANRSLSNVAGRQMAYASAIAPSAKGGVYYSKPGSTPGYTSIILWRTQPKVGIVVLANRGGVKSVDELGKKLIEAAVR